MRFWGINAGGGSRSATLVAAVAAAAVLVGTAAVPTARAAAPAVTPYGQVAAVGSLDTAADFSQQNTTGNLTEGDFIDPVGMAVAPDSSSPGGEDIYVLDLVNPQAMNTVVADQSADNVELEYRLQKLAITPSTTIGSDTGSETVLACTTFTLQSTPAAPDQRAVSLAVDGPLNQVDVLINEMPDYQGISPGYSIAEQVEQWPTTLAGGPANTCPATASPTVAVPSTSLVKKNDPGLRGDIDGDSLTFAGTGTAAQLALGGSQYLSSPASTGTSKTQPIIDLFSGGSVSATWTKSELAANAYAKSGPIAGKDSAPGWGIDQTTTLSLGSGASGYGDVLYSLSSNPDGTLNVSLGPQEVQLIGLGGGADFEPIMATVSADLSTTTPVLPSPEASPTYNFPPGWNVNDTQLPFPDLNSESAATDIAAQDTADDFGLSGIFAPGGGTQNGGTLAPSVVALAGSASGLYAGYVADNLGGSDSNLDQFGNPVAQPAWTVPNPTVGGTTANLGVRIFTGCGTGTCASGTPLAMIGNAGSGPCSLRSGAYGFSQTAVESTIALAAGPNGTIYALTQPDLDAVTGGTISPAHPVSGAGVGDTLMEFLPGAGSGTSAGVACPGPSGSFAVTDVSDPSAGADTGTGAVQVLAGATIQFDASSIDLQGGVPWSYTWDSDAGASDDQTASSTFTPDASTQVYDRANPTQTFVYTTPGQDTAQIQLESDFGTTTVSRPIDVVAPGPITADVSAAGGAVAGQPTTLSAAGTAVAAPDSIVDYHWDFGNGTSDDSAGPSETWTFPSAGTYSVTLTAIDQLGRTQTATTQVSVAAPPPAPPAPAPAPTTPPPGPHAAKFSVAPKLRSVKDNADLSAKLSCPAGDRTCAGTIAVLTAGKVAVPGKKGKKQLPLGKGTFTVTAGHSKTMLIKLAAVTSKLISPQAPLKLTVLVVAHDSAGARATQRLPVYLFPPAKSRPRKFG